MIFCAALAVDLFLGAPHIVAVSPAPAFLRQPVTADAG